MLTQLQDKLLTMLLLLHEIIILETLLKWILILMIKIFTFLDQKLLNENHNFTPSEIETTIRPNTFTAQDARIFSNAELDQFWNRILFSKHSYSTLQRLGKTLSYSFIFSNTPDYDANSLHENLYNTLRIGIHIRLINLPPFFTYMGLRCFYCTVWIPMLHSTSMLNIFFNISFHSSNTYSHYQTISIKYILKQNISIFGSIAQGFFNILTAEMVNDFNDIHLQKPKIALKGSKL